MFIQTVEGKNFRGLPDFSLNLHERLNVFTGKNGVGKSSILNFITLMFSQCRSITSDSLNATYYDINHDKTEFSGKIKCRHGYSYILAEYLCSEIYIKSHYFENFSGDFNDTNEKNNPLSKLYIELKNNTSFKKNFPIVVSYPTNRAVTVLNENLREFNPAVHPFYALENALEDNLDFHWFFALFRMREMAVEQDGKDSAPYARWQAKQVRAVQDALCAIIPEFSGLHVSQEPFEISVQKNNRTLDFMQLSDGEKCLIALLGDLALRLAICNPALDNPLEGDAVVLIDELELHLHPVWQSALIPRLLKTFPNCQFIVTTNSPLILSGVQADSIWIMHETDAPYHPQRSYGMDSSEVLQEVMGAPSRPADVTEALYRIDCLLDADKFDEARTAIQELAAKTGKIPAIYGANSYLTMMGEKQADIQ